MCRYLHEGEIEDPRVLIQWVVGLVVRRTRYHGIYDIRSIENEMSTGI
jgi:hypothetical protein